MTRPDKTPDETRQDKTRADKRCQEKTREHKTTQDKTTRHYKTRHNKQHYAKPTHRRSHISQLLVVILPFQSLFCFQNTWLTRFPQWKLQYYHCFSSINVFFVSIRSFLQSMTCFFNSIAISLLSFLLQYPLGCVSYYYKFRSITLHRGSITILF